MRTFTLAEALELLPYLEGLLRRALKSRDAAKAIERSLTALTRRIQLSGGLMVDIGEVMQHRREMDRAVESARDALSEIDSVGVQIKDLDSGLLDFPYELDGEIVLLCWKLGEESITHWHTLDSGFSGRQPIDERFGSRSDRGTLGSGFLPN